MDARPLPARPHLDHYRKQAKELLRSARAGDEGAAGRLRHALGTRERAGETGAYALADAQFALAREHGFESWPRFAAHVEALTYRDAPAARFEAAADAVVAGDEGALARLLAEDPALARARSTRAHHATLLHYVAANGVEDFRQQTPPNAVDVAHALLRAGADVNAAADSYGGGAHQTTLHLLLSSVHPARAGLQSAIADVLVDGGAPIDGSAGDGGPLLTAIAFQYPDAADALVRRGARVHTLLAAAGVGRTDLVRRFLAAGTPGPSAPWLRLPATLRAHAERALVWAAVHGHADVVEVLARHGVALDARDEQGFTALHWAAMRGQLDALDRLLALGAPTQARNAYGGTVVGAAVWASAHMDGVFRRGGFVRVDHAPVFARLRAAGAT